MTGRSPTPSRRLPPAVRLGLTLLGVLWLMPHPAPAPADTVQAENVPADTDQTDTAPAGATANAASPQSLLPASFDTLRPIYFFQGQGSEVIPDHFRPIAIGQLDQRLTIDGAPPSVFEKPQLNRAVYVVRMVDAALVSQATSWEISHDSATASRLMLGRLGLAIQSANVATGSGAGYRPGTAALVTEPDGQASLLVHGDTKLNVAWTAAGRESEREVEFDLAVPRAEQARWLIEVPQGMRLEALDGVGRGLPSPPPEAASADGARGSWYAVEAGGLDRLRLRVLKSTVDGGQANVIVRQASVQHELTPASIHFAYRLRIDPPADGYLPSFQVNGGRVLAISVDNVATPWQESNVNGTRLIRLQPPHTATAGQAITIRIDGEATWEGDHDLQPLPWVRLRECVPILIGDRLHGHLHVDSRLTLLRLNLPDRWRQLAAAETDERRTSYQMEGPWSDAPPVVCVVPAGQPLVAESLLRLSSNESRFRAVWEAAIGLPPSGPQPIRLRFEPGWTAESVVLPQSGRSVELPADFATRREVVVWPTSDELVDGRLRLRVSGWRPFRIDGDVARYPATAFVTFTGGHNRFAAVVSPPSGFQWDSEASLQNHRIAAASLSDFQRAVLGTPPADSLLLDITQGRILTLTSRRPAATFHVTSHTSLQFQSGVIAERHTLRCESASGELDRIRVEFAADNRPDLEWSIQDERMPPRRLIRASRLGDGSSNQTPPRAAEPASVGSEAGDAAEPEPREIWELELERQAARSVVLIGRRETNVPSANHSDGHAGDHAGDDATAGDASRDPAAIRLALPSVLAATNRTATVFVPATLELVAVDDGVLRVPADSDQGPGIALRYDSSSTHWIDLRPATNSSLPTVLWSESVQLTTSQRGGDWIEAHYRVAKGEQLELQYDADLRLSEVTDGRGRNLAHDRTPGNLRVPLEPLTETVVVKWSRPPIAVGWLTRWTRPLIRPQAVSLQSDWQITGAADTWLPRPGGNPLYLVDRTVLLSLLTMTALAVFGAAWSLALRSVTVTAALFLLAVAALPWLPSDQMHYWVMVACVPLAAGGLLGNLLAIARRPPPEPLADPSRSRSQRSATTPAGRDPAPTVRQLNKERSAAIRLPGRLSLWATLLLSPIAAPTFAQPPNNSAPHGFINQAAAGNPNATRAETADAATAGQPRPEVLIPTRPDGSLAGDKVYISQGYYNDLFRERTLAPPTPRITAAVYRLRLDGMSEAGMPRADWEIRYSLADLSERSELALPFRPADVRSVQWLPGGEAKPLRWVLDGESQIRVSLPPTAATAMLVRLSTDVQSPERLLRRLQLAIPPVVASSLVVDTGSAVQLLELRGAIGRVIPTTGSGRLTADLGAISSIDLDIGLRQSGRGIPAIAARRYWMHAASQTCQVECEIEPQADSLRRGADFPIVVLGGHRATLTSPDWQVHADEMISPQRQLLTLRSLREDAGPVRLLWQFPIETADSLESAQAVAFELPEVISAGSAPTPPAQLAWQVAEGLQLVPLGGLPEEPLDPTQAAELENQFMTQWQGYRSDAQAVIDWPGTQTRWAVINLPPPPWHSNERHHLHVRPGEMRLAYDAVVTRGPQTIGPLRLTYPASCELRELTINGQNVSFTASSFADRSEVALPELPGGEPLTLHVVAHQRLSPDTPFAPPWIRVAPIDHVQGTYTLTRDQGMRVEQLQATSLPELREVDLDIRDQLLSGYFPCWSWQLTSISASGELGPRVWLDGLFQAEQRISRFDSVQRTAIRWNDARWAVDVLIQARARASDRNQASDLLDDLHVELPTQWSDQLIVEPAEAWSSQPAIDPSKQIIRIRPTAADREAGLATVRLRAFRIGDAESSLEVPSVRVMGAATAQAFLAVPPAAGGRPLQWQVQAAVAENLPAGLEDAQAAAAGDLVYRTLGPAATVRLQPSRPDVAEPTVSATDIHLFTNNHCPWLALVRWDVEPGDADSLLLDIPPSVTPLALWAGDQARELPPLHPPSPTSSPRSAPSTAQLEVPLALSQLAHPLILLCQITPPPTGQAAALPVLADVPVAQSWLTVYRPQPGPAAATDPPTISLASPPAAATTAGWSTADPADHWLALAQSVLQVTDASTGAAMDRPQEELAQWLAHWSQRIGQLRMAANVADQPERTWGPLDNLLPTPRSGTLPGLGGELIGGELMNEATSPLSAAAATPRQIDRRWDDLTQQWEQFVRRTGGATATGPSTSPLVTAAAPSEHWRVDLVANLPAAATELPPLTSGRSDAVLQTAIHSVLLLCLIAGILAFAWRFRDILGRPWAHPASWLLALGLASLAVTPLPVSLAICAVAIAAPLLGQAEPA